MQKTWKGQKKHPTITGNHDKIEKAWFSLPFGVYLLCIYEENSPNKFRRITHSASCSIIHWSLSLWEPETRSFLWFWDFYMCPREPKPIIRPLETPDSPTNWIRKRMNWKRNVLLVSKKPELRDFTNFGKTGPEKSETLSDILKFLNMGSTSLQNHVTFWSNGFTIAPKPWKLKKNTNISGTSWEHH